MAGKTQTLKLKRTIAQPPAEVYRALTRTSVLRTWFCDAAQADVRKGGRLYLYWNEGYRVIGEFTAAEPGKQVAFTWHGNGEPEPTQVQIKLKEKNGGTALTLEHSGMGAGKKWNGAAEALAHEWENALDNLQSVLETGEDLRLVRRPMLGITGFSELDTEAAAKLGVPVKQGIRIGGTVPGMGAEAAGLKADDVVVSIGKTKLTHFPHISLALQQHHAGDAVPVTFYRGAEKLTLPMTLSRRPLPPLPATGAELAEVARKIYEADDAAIAQVFEGVSEEEAGKRPDPKEWSAKEVLTHLIVSERGTQDGISWMLTDSEPWFDDFDNDLDARPRALLSLHPTVGALLNELKRCEAETLALLAALPPEFIARKRNYWRLCLGTLQPPTHVQTHLEQMRAAIEAAQKS
jgi:uncharacterized protein YndB with AHSA1/START domain